MCNSPEAVFKGTAIDIERQKPNIVGLWSLRERVAQLKGGGIGFLVKEDLCAKFESLDCKAGFSMECGTVIPCGFSAWHRQQNT